MNVTLMSDLHLEWCEMPKLEAGETLLLSGDIMVAATMAGNQMVSKNCRKNYSLFLNDVVEKFKTIYYIAGNHEHYHSDLKNTLPRIRHYLKQFPKINFLHNETVALTDKTMLFGATMWTNMNNRDCMALMAGRNGLNDFRLITHNMSRPFTVEDSVNEHEATLVAMETDLGIHKDKDFLVMTHHTPSFLSIHPKYGNDLLNYCYSSDLSKFILDNPRIKHWVHGHTHDSFDYTIGETRIMCNPRGYTRNPDVPPENYKFNIKFNFEVQ